jgi:hypothetical protein
MESEQVLYLAYKQLGGLKGFVTDTTIPAEYVMSHYAIFPGS